MAVKEISREEVLEKLKDKRQKCMVYTRVMGYHRPVESFNIGKKPSIKRESIIKNVRYLFLSKILLS